MRNNNMKSLLINQVHDSLVVDCYPGEEKRMLTIMRDAMLGVIPELSERFQYEFSVPLAIEIKQGPNWLDMDTVLVASHNET